MRWPYTSPPPRTPVGARRVRCHFLFWPLCLPVDGKDRKEWRWLEFAWVGEVYGVAGYHVCDGGASPWHGWLMECFTANPAPPPPVPSPES